MSVSCGTPAARTSCNGSSKHHRLLSRGERSLEPEKAVKDERSEDFCLTEGVRKRMRELYEEGGEPS